MSRLRRESAEPLVRRTEDARFKKAWNSAGDRACHVEGIRQIDQPGGAGSMRCTGSSG